MRDQIEGEGVGRSCVDQILREGVAWDLLVSLLVLAVVEERREYVERGVVARWVGGANEQATGDGNGVKHSVVFAVLREIVVEINLEQVYDCCGDRLKLLVGDEELY